MSSPLESKFHSDKNTKKKYQNFKATQNEKVNAVSSETKRDNIQNAEKPSWSFFDAKHFPELKVSQSNYFGAKNKNWAHIVSYGPEILCNLPDRKYVKKDAVDIDAKKNQSTQPVIENTAGTNRKKKTYTSKKPSTQGQRNPNKKKRADPVLINFQDILTKNKVQRKTKQHNIAKRHARKFRDKDLLSGNLLDSSNPTRSRGKQREVKKKKLSNLKMTIIKERILKRKIREKQAEDPHFEKDGLDFIGSIDFKTEINNYLNELRSKRLESSKASYNKSKDKENDNKINKQQSEGNVKNESTEKHEDCSKKVNDNVKEKKNFNVTEGGIKFSKKFREYCNNIITPDLNAAVTEFIKEVVRLQDRLFLNDPIKAKARKRHVTGIREVKKYLTLKKVKMIIIAPNLEKLQMEGSVDDSIDQLKSMAESQNVPYVFALDRYILGRCTKKNVPISVFAVMNYEGTEILYDSVMRELFEARRIFSELAGKDSETKKEEKEDDVNANLLSSLILSFREELRMSSDAESRAE